MRSYNDDLYAGILPSYTDSLTHHGIKGQKWGVRRFQNEDGSYTSRGKKHRLDSIKNAGAKAKDIVTSDKFKKAAAIGAGVAGTALVAYGGYQLAQNADLTADPNFDASTGFMKQAGNHSYMDDYNGANPLFMVPGDDFKHNCPYASMAYEMRRRGFDVRAGGNPHGMSPDQIDRMYRKAEVHDIEPTYNDESKTLVDLIFSRASKEASTPEYKKAQSKRVDAIIEQAAQFGPNARGNIEVYFSQGGGHIFAFENDSRGRVNFMDAQSASYGKASRRITRAFDRATGRKLLSRRIVHVTDTLFHGGRGSGYDKLLREQIDPSMQCRVRRTDNAEIDYDFLHENKIVRNPSVVKRTFRVGV